MLQHVQSNMGNIGHEYIYKYYHNVNISLSSLQQKHSSKSNRTSRIFGFQCKLETLDEVQWASSITCTDLQNLLTARKILNVVHKDSFSLFLEMIIPIKIKYYLTLHSILHQAIFKKVFLKVFIMGLLRLKAHPLPAGKKMPAELQKNARQA